MVGERVPRQLRLQPGLHRRRELAADVRVRLGDRAEVFGAWTVVRRIDRDVRPLFLSAQPEAGGVVNEYPFVRQGWSDNQLGDSVAGREGQPAVAVATSSRSAFAVRGMVKLPTAKDDDEGVGTGKTDFAFDAIVSKEVNQRVEVSGYGGYIFRGDPDDVDLTNGFRWGFGAGVPSRRRLRFTGGAARRAVLRRHASPTQATRLIGDDGSLPPTVTRLDVAGQRDARPDVAGEERVLRRRRRSTGT